jgi:hypothetical protein
MAQRPELSTRLHHSTYVTQDQQRTRKFHEDVIERPPVNARGVRALARSVEPAGDEQNRINAGQERSPSANPLSLPRVLAQDRRLDLRPELAEQGGLVGVCRGGVSLI